MPPITETERRFVTPFRSERKLAAAVYYQFGVVIPSWRCCPHHSTPWQAFVDAYYARSPVVIWKASRGYGGKSYLLSVLGSMLAAAEGSTVNVLGGSLEQSARVLETLEDLWEFPAVRRDRLLLEAPSKRKWSLKNGAWIKAQPASQKSVRGSHPNRLLLDELDEMDIKIFDAAMGQTMDGGDGLVAGVVGASTQQYPRGTMHELLRRGKEKGWKIHEWCYRESLKTADTPYGWLKPAEVAKKLETVTEKMRLAEYEGMEPEMEGLIFELPAVQALFSPEHGGEYSGLEREDVILEEPVPQGDYAHGADWAKEVDRTVIVTLRTDLEPARVVAWWAGNKQPYTSMAERLNARVQKYGGTVCHDKTGIGNVVHDLLGVEAEGFTMTGKPRNDLLIDYIAAVEKGRIIAPRISLAYDEHRYATNEDLFTTQGHLPDTMAALALAARAAFGSRLAWASA